MKGNCEICNKEIEVTICCNAFDCGCQGKPIEPPVCSQECYDKYMTKRDSFKFGGIPITEVDLPDLNTDEDEDK